MWFPDDPSTQQSSHGFFRKCINVCRVRIDVKKMNQADFSDLLSELWIDIWASDYPIRAEKMKNRVGRQTWFRCCSANL